LIVEFSGDEEEVEQAARGLAVWGTHSRDCYDSPTLFDPAEHKKVWETRRLGLGLISNVKGSVKGQAFVEDACVPVEVLAEYIDKLKAICDRRGVASTMYAHASVGVIHFRPELDLHLREHQEHMKGIADEAFELVVQYGGAFAGEHGDGQLRGEYVPRFYGPKLYEAFRQVKGLFDPKGLMNPGKIVDAPSMIDPSMLRYGSAYKAPEIPTGFRYGDQGGFRLAVEQCNGVGACRKVGSGVMCPSYMATREEQDSTRGRANALRLAMSGQLDGDALAALGSDEVHKVLELCLSCKACKSECPNAVDMAKMKADSLQLRYKQHGVPRSAKLFGEFPDQLRKYGNRFGKLASFVTKLPGARKLIEYGTGVDPRRPLPTPAPESLEKLLAQSSSRSNVTRGKVVLFDDTFANYLEPNIGRAAFELLQSLGYEVILARAGCCQRPRISVGLVDEAKQHGAETIANLDKYASEGLPIVCLEPSCASSLADDLPDLVDDQAAGKRVAEKVQLLESFLLSEGIELECDAVELKLHGHCHQKAVFGTQDLHKLFDSIEGTTLTEIEAGCCGMAGSFGYSHYDLSEQI
ncbi:MAG: FAD-linked oxidase C-terminal domain-containing protein, partial [Lacipirellulaceae bacterium]